MQELEHLRKFTNQSYPLIRVYIVDNLLISCGLRVQWLSNSEYLVDIVDNWGDSAKVKHQLFL